MLHLEKYFSVPEQENLVELTRNIAKTNGGMTIPIMPNGAPFNCSQTSCGLVGWISDRDGYRYSRINPVNKEPFATMPTELIEIAQELAKQVNEPHYRPDTCLINFYPAILRTLFKEGCERNTVEE